MDTRKEYLSKLDPPLAKVGKGRISAAGHAAIDAAHAKGMRFSDVKYSDSAEPVKSAEVSKSSEAEMYFGATPDRLYNGGWHIMSRGKKLKVSGNEVCRSCRTSLDWHSCNLPTFPDPASNDIVPVMR